MREVLFRGKRKDNNEWVYGSLQCFKGVSIFDTVWKNWFTVCHETVGQYTGLTDKNNKRVFEGDILCNDIGCGGKWFYIVEFNDGEFELKADDEEDAYTFINRAKAYKVVGNICDNPDLLTYAYESR